MVTTARTRRRKRDDRVGLLLLLAAAILAAALGGPYAFIARRQPKLDAKTNCPEGGPVAVTVLLVDRTQPLSPIQQEALRQEFIRIKDGIAKDTALEIYSIGPIATEVLRPELPRLCNPGGGGAVSEWTGNPKMAQQRWLAGFDKPVQDILLQLAHPGNQESSPILESLESVALTALPAEMGQRKLIIVSDMLQNTGEFSQYRERIRFGALRATPYYKRVRADLRGVDVEIIYIRRDDPHQDAEHIRFWQEYFADVGASLNVVKKLVG